MAPKFSLDFKKIKLSDSVGHTLAHNSRTRPTDSQLPKSAWFNSQGHDTIIPWRESVMNKARTLAKRKDAVVGLKVFLQVGNQADWRHAPTEADKFGKPKANGEKPCSLKSLVIAARKTLEEEFGAENIVSLDLHTDESTPHFHAVVVPIKNNVLCQKHWNGGFAALKRSWARFHEKLNQNGIACEYDPHSVTGGEPHDARKAAGQAWTEPVGFFEKIKALPEKQAEVSRLKKLVKQLQDQLAKAMSKARSYLKRATKAEDEVKQEQAKTRDALTKASTIELELSKLRHELKSTKSDNFDTVTELEDRLRQKDEEIRLLSRSTTTSRAGPKTGPTLS